MKQRYLTTSVALALGLGFASTAFAQAKPDVLVKQRQAVMTLQGKYLGPIGAMIKGAAPYNADVVAINATFLENLARMPWDGFQASTEGVKSAAKPEVYKDAAKFKAAGEALEAATEWPAIIRSCCGDLLGRGQMPLADCVGVVAILLEDLRE